MDYHPFPPGEGESRLRWSGACSFRGRNKALASSVCTVGHTCSAEVTVDNWYLNIGSHLAPFLFLFPWQWGHCCFAQGRCWMVWHVVWTMDWRGFRQVSLRFLNKQEKKKKNKEARQNIFLSNPVVWQSYLQNQVTAHSASEEHGLREHTIRFATSFCQLPYWNNQKRSGGDSFSEEMQDSYICEW